jgi:L-alanine-DL-glutamate epimerase-like enolase superfamily enzyme
LVVDPRALAERLSAWPVRLGGVRCRSGRVALADYPGGRPLTLVALSGQGHTGWGEHVAFSDDEQQAFVLAVESHFATAEGPVATILRPGIPTYARAALESAIIDLALRQAGASLRDLTGVDAAPLRWVCSFADPDPAARARACGGEVKVDVDPAWTEATIVALAREPVAILDFKGTGTLALAARLAAAFPAAIFEDPPEGTAGVRVARDRSLLTEPAVVAAVGRGEAVNLKAPRMGGFLPLLRALGHAREAGALAYLGGMFEAGPGREQARQIAALYCADAPNDLAPLAGGLGSIEGGSPAPVRLDAPGFGATVDWARLEIT